MDKIKEFFTKKPVMITEAVLLAVGAAGLTVAGVSSQSINSIAAVSVAVVTAIDAVITAIAALFGKKE